MKLKEMNGNAVEISAGSVKEVIQRGQSIIVICSDGNEYYSPNPFEDTKAWAGRETTEQNTRVLKLKSLFSRKK